MNYVITCFIAFEDASGAVKRSIHCGHGQSDVDRWRLWIDVRDRFLYCFIDFFLFLLLCFPSIRWL